MKYKQLPQSGMLIAGVAVVAGSVLKLMDQVAAPWVFSIGALLIVYNQLVFALMNKDAQMVQQRLSRIAFMASLLLAVAGYSMFHNSSLWVPALLIYALITIYVSFRLK